MVIGEGITLTGVQIVGPLWQNASPTASFAAQTVALDLSGYDAIILVNRHWTNNSLCRSHYIPTDGNTYGCPVQNNVGGWAGRTCTATASGVVFDAGVGTSGIDNNGGIPLAIYGIKGVTRLTT